MKTQYVQQLDRTILSRHIHHYSTDKLRVIFRRLPSSKQQTWMEHFIEKEEYEVCKVLKEVMEEPETYQ